ncbi:MAG: hypothetical protein K9J27_07780 [Bacteroidales bacterium]|nr:hypothetical protein [Bacteroidales bacterium]MCF8334723.1 hypothetical protein [Bacteroidales bacterium]
MPDKYTQVPLEPDKFFHIYNRGNNYERVFYETKKYTFFLQRYKYYLGQYAQTFAFCLMPNHFHLLIKVISPQMSKKFADFMQSYVKSFNNMYHRHGSLFLKNFKRIEVINDDQLKRLVFYIHYNPEKHEISEDFRSYYFSSYRSLISDRATSLARKDVLDWYGGKNEFVEFHSYLKNIKISEKLAIED